MDNSEALGHFIAGYISGEGSFYITLPQAVSGQVQCGFALKVQAADRELVELIRQTMGESGRLYVSAARGGTVAWQVRSQRELVSVIIPFFDRYPLRGQQQRTYVLWRQAVLLMWDNAHLTHEGLSAIAAIKAQLNRD